MSRCYRLSVLAILMATCRLAAAAEHELHRFKPIKLTDVYYSEGADAGDLNRDGKPTSSTAPTGSRARTSRRSTRSIPPSRRTEERYADHFFAWVYDFNGDGWNDVLTAGFPGTPAFVYENPRRRGLRQATGRSTRCSTRSATSRRSSSNIVGDERPELVCTRDGFFGYATFDPNRPFEAWTFHAISDKVAPIPFGHGLGVGDVNGDGRTRHAHEGRLVRAAEVARRRPPVELPPGARSRRIGGADMYAYDVDGDGDNDVITSLAAHDFGLAWHEQVRDGDEIVFRQHLIMGERARAESLRPRLQRAALGQPGRYRRRRAEGHRHRQDLLLAPQAEPDVGRRRGGLLVPAGADARTAWTGCPTRPTASRASAGSWSSTTSTATACPTSWPAA